MTGCTTTGRRRSRQRKEVVLGEQAEPEAFEREYDGFGRHEDAGLKGQGGLVHEHPFAGMFAEGLQQVRTGRGRSEAQGIAGESHALGEADEHGGEEGGDEQEAHAGDAAVSRGGDPVREVAGGERHEPREGQGQVQVVVGPEGPEPAVPRIGDEQKEEGREVFWDAITVGPGSARVQSGGRSGWTAGCRIGDRRSEGGAGRGRQFSAVAQEREEQAGGGEQQEVGIMAQESVEERAAGAEDGAGGGGRCCRAGTIGWRGRWWVCR